MSCLKWQVWLIEALLWQNVILEDSRIILFLTQMKKECK